MWKMGGRQSSPAGTSASLSANNSPARMYPSSSNQASGEDVGTSSRGLAINPPDLRPRTRSLSNVLQPSASSNGHNASHNHYRRLTHHLPPSLTSMAGLPFGLTTGSPDSDTSADEMVPFGRFIAAHSLPVQPFLPFNGEYNLTCLSSHLI